MAQTLSQILNSVRPDGWTQKLNKIKEHIKKYDEFRTGSSYHSSDEILKYLNEILPTYWDVFHTHNTYRRKHEKLPKCHDDETLLPFYHIGIFLVGYSSLPIALSLAEIQPTEQIYFLYSSDTRNYLSEIYDRLAAMFKDTNQELLSLVEETVLHNLDESALAIDDASDPVSTFKQIKEIIDNIDESENKRIALDLTGGKKTMLGGGYTAGAIWASRWSAESKELSPFCNMYYIDSKEYDPNGGKPVPGTEFLSQLVNPYDVYNVQSNQQARKLFEKNNFDAAMDLWKDVKDTLEKHASRYGLKTEFNKTVDQHRMATCYYLWDSFYYDKAKNSKNRHKNSWGYNEKHVKNSIDVLNILSEVSDRKTLFKNEARIIHYAVDRYQNGMRRKESGKLEDAIVRFAQVIEMICNYRIYRLSQDNCFVEIGNNGPYRLSATEKWEFNPINLLFDNKPVDLRSVRKTCHLLQDKKIDATDYDCQNVDEIFTVIQPRHNFIHFNNPQRPTEAGEDTEKLRELAHKFLEKFLQEYCSGYSLDLDDLLELHEFRLPRAN